MVRDFVSTLWKFRDSDCESTLQSFCNFDINLPYFNHFTSVTPITPWIGIRERRRWFLKNFCGLESCNNITINFVIPIPNMVIQIPEFLIYIPPSEIFVTPMPPKFRDWSKSDSHSHHCFNPLVKYIRMCNSKMM